MAAAAVGERGRARRLGEQSYELALQAPEPDDRPGWLYWLDPVRAKLILVKSPTLRGIGQQRSMPSSRGGLSSKASRVIRRSISRGYRTPSAACDRHRQVETLPLYDVFAGGILERIPRHWP
ncbi:hypothetical protein UK12_02100 [Saccharothrix sp. ST-888]|nr:hypothetical protein UK12_02100 [Saccharothrix sp. ST-888]